MKLKTAYGIKWIALIAFLFNLSQSFLLFSHQNHSFSKSNLNDNKVSIKKNNLGNCDLYELEIDEVEESLEDEIEGDKSCSSFIIHHFQTFQIKKCRQSHLQWQCNLFQNKVTYPYIFILNQNFRI